MSDGVVSGNSSSSKSLMWMTAALFAGMAVLLVGGLFLATRVIRSVGIRSSVGPQTVHTQNGIYQLEREKEVGPPVPMYPGATLVVASDESAAQSAKDAENGTAKVVYLSTDPRDMVDQWYGDHLPKVFQRYDASTASFPDLFRQAGVKDTDIAYSADKNGHTRIVELMTSSTGTKITIIRVDRPEDSESNPPQP